MCNHCNRKADYKPTVVTETVFEKVIKPYGQTKWKALLDRNDDGTRQYTQRCCAICTHVFETLVLGCGPTAAYLPIGTQYSVKFVPQLIKLGAYPKPEPEGEDK